VGRQSGQHGTGIGTPGKIAALLIPGAENDAPRRTAVEIEPVDRRPVRVTMDQGANACGSHRREDRGRIHVHDLGLRAPDVPLTSGAGLGRELPPHGQRQP